MRSIIYSLAGHGLNLLLRVLALRSQKIRKMLEGRKETISKLRTGLRPDKPSVWFHVASLGEFEQARPVVERWRQERPEWQIVISFYSPSGYEVHYNYEHADCVVYLPGDTGGEVRAFLDAFRPEIAIFVKYDYWPVMLEELHKRQTPTHLISAIFRKEQLFFKPWGVYYRHLLGYFEHLFVQDETSVQLLAGIGIRQVSIAGDTRFDRVAEIAKRSAAIPEIEAWQRGERPLIVAGSTWGIDEEMLLKYAEQAPEVCWIFAPHELEEERMQRLEQAMGANIVRLSGLRSGVEMPGELKAIIIDNFGLLSSLYRYADIAYVGGGFGKSIHNTIEAAVYDIPVIFGPKHHKFREAQLLISSGGGYSVASEEELLALLTKLVEEEALRQDAGQRAGEVVSSECGATQMILEHISQDHMK